MLSWIFADIRHQYSGSTVSQWHGDHLAVMVSSSVMYKAFARDLSTSSQQLIIRLHDIPGSTGFCGSINASERDVNIFEFSAKFMYIATINENNFVLKGGARWFSDATH